MKTLSRPTPTTVEVWSVSLDPEPADMARWAASLSDEEKARAQAMRFAEHRSRFIVAHGALRVILASYLGREPVDLRFAVDPGGKPRLRLEGGEIDLRYSLSHSHGLGLVAVTTGGEVGVDIERVDSRIEVLKLARHYFAPEETADLEVLPPPARVGAFFRYWTLKEAFIKAIGTGLSMPLDSFAVSSAGEGPTRLLRSAHADTDHWTLHAFEPTKRYAAALATEENSVGEASTGYSLRSWPPADLSEP